MADARKIGPLAKILLTLGVASGALACGALAGTAILTADIEAARGTPLEAAASAESLRICTFTAGAVGAAWLGFGAVCAGLKVAQIRRGRQHSAS
ncbi:hypothetical protein FACS1894186_2960 [Alphaproteobacteria bacterium]|nr:hypothetical protein FACS1894186_2960 [Alphaproteobacteria bacterium]